MQHQQIYYDLGNADDPIFKPAPLEPVAPLYDCGYEPGMYFGMKDEDYHKIPALSSSGIRNLLISPMDFWARSWMNPDHVDDPTDAMDLGRAYHARILEGGSVFEDRYAPAFDKAAYPNALDTNEEMKEALKSMDLKVSGNKPDLIARLREADPNILILDDIKAEYLSRCPGKEFLSVGTIKRIEIAAAMIEKHPDLSRAFTGGYPEVTVLWSDLETGVPMKARLDYLKAQAIVDLKTFSNPQGKPIDRAIYGAMASGRYHVQAATYIEADSHAMRFAQAGMVKGDVDAEWLRSYANQGQSGEGRTFFFVFQQTGIAPVARGRIFPRHLIYDCGVLAMRDGISKFANHFKAFGVDPWIDTDAVKHFDDHDFPPYMTEV